MSLHNADFRNRTKHVTADEKGIVARSVAADEGVSPAVDEVCDRRQRRSPVQPRPVLLTAYERRIVWHAAGRLCAESDVVFRDDDPRVHDADGFENPIVVAVEVDRQQADVALDSGCPDQGIDVRAVDEGGLRVDVVTPSQTRRT